MLNSVLRIWLDEMTSGTPDLEAYRQYVNSESSYLTFLENWKEVVGFTLATQPKLNGNGSFITGTQNDNKTLRMTITSSYENELALLANIDTLQNHIFSHLQAPVASRLELQYFNAPGYNPIVRRETYIGYLTYMSDLVEANDSEDLNYSLEFTVVDPEPTVTIY